MSVAAFSSLWDAARGFEERGRRLKLVLASASPRRAEILRNAGFAFAVHPAHVDESLLANEEAENYVRRLAETKALNIANSLRGDDSAALVIGADTVVRSEARILGKPADANEAGTMLRQLSGRTHDVLTGIALVRVGDGTRNAHVEITRVSFLPLSDADIEAYVATGEPFDKAGAYGIQGLAGKFVSRIEGCYFNVMGLPLSRLWQMLRESGWSESESL